MKNRLVLRFRRHGMVECRDKEHQENRHHKDAHTHRCLHRVSAVDISPHRSKRKRKERQYAHHSMRYGVAYLLAKCRYVYLCHKLQGLRQALHLNQFGIYATQSQQFGMCTLLGDASLVDYNDAVGVVNRAQAVSNHNRSTTLQERSQSLLH